MAIFRRDENARTRASGRRQTPRAARGPGHGRGRGGAGRGVSGRCGAAAKPGQMLRLRARRVAARAGALSPRERLPDTARRGARRAADRRQRLERGGGAGAGGGRSDEGGAAEEIEAVPPPPLDAEVRLERGEIEQLAAMVAQRRRLLDMRLAGAAEVDGKPPQLRQRVGAEPPLSMQEWAVKAGIEEAALRRALVDGRHARERLLQSVWPMTLRLSRHMARQLRLPGDDAVVAGLAGALMAVDRYDPTRGASLATYTTPWVRKYVYSAHLDRRLVEVPNNARAEAHSLRRARDALLSDRRKQVLDRDGGGEEERLSAIMGEGDEDGGAGADAPLGDVAIEELSKRASVSRRRAEQLVPIMDRRWMRSPIDSSYTVGLGHSGGDSTNDYGLVDQPDPRAIDSRALARDVRSLVDSCEALSVRERAVLALRYRLDEDSDSPGGIDNRGTNERSRGDCAARLGISMQKLRSLEKKALSKLRENPQYFEEYAADLGFGRAGVDDAEEGSLAALLDATNDQYNNAGASGDYEFL